jgi:hypothetical protein
MFYGNLNSLASTAMAARKKVRWELQIERRNFGSK